jgi:hypothetical protein
VYSILGNQEIRDHSYCSITDFIVHNASALKGESRQSIIDRNTESQAVIDQPVNQVW